MWWMQKKLKFVFHFLTTFIPQIALQLLWIVKLANKLLASEGTWNCPSWLGTAEPIGEFNELLWPDRERKSVSVIMTPSLHLPSSYAFPPGPKNFPVPASWPNNMQSAHQVRPWMNLQSCAGPDSNRRMDGKSKSHFCTPRCKLRTALRVASRRCKASQPPRQGRTHAGTEILSFPTKISRNHEESWTFRAKFIYYSSFALHYNLLGTEPEHNSKHNQIWFDLTRKFLFLFQNQDVWNW